ncbi:MAG: sensor histidine kinase, partial [Thermoanaerobaculia bacterium]
PYARLIFEMQDTRRMPREALYERDRGEALKSFLRRFRHEIATPLSGANLHLEVALRRLQKPGGFDLAAVVENLRTCQQSLETASRMLELIGEVSHEESVEASEFSMRDALARAADSFRAAAKERDLQLELPAPGPGPRWYGSSREFELAVAEITNNAVSHSSGPGSIRWSIEQRPSEILVTCRSSGRIPVGDPEHLFGSARREGSPGSGFGLLRARRAVQGSGGELTLRQEDGEVCAVLSFRARES